MLTTPRLGEAEVHELIPGECPQCRTPLPPEARAALVVGGEYACACGRLFRCRVTLEPALGADGEELSVGGVLTFRF